MLPVLEGPLSERFISLQSCEREKTPKQAWSQ